MEITRSVIITGSLRGLGYQFTRRLILEGKHKVIITYRDLGSSLKLIKELQSLNPLATVEYHQLAVDQKESCDSFANWVQEKLGTFDVLVNNAGSFHKLSKGMMDRQSKFTNPGDVAKDVLTSNVLGVIYLTNLLLPYLSQDGKIVNVSAGLGRLQSQSETNKKEMTNQDMDETFIMKKVEELIQMRMNSQLVGWTEHQITGLPNTIYCASKVLLNAFTRYVLPKNFSSALQTAICLHPGWVKTENNDFQQTDLNLAEERKSMYRATVEFEFGNPKYEDIFLEFKGDQ